MRIGIDYTAAARQRAGIGRYTRELVRALLAHDRQNDYTLFAATGRVEPGSYEWEQRDNVRVRTVPISDDWLARIWHRLRLPVPVELATGPLDVFYSPDFALPPTLRGTRTLLTVHDLSFLHYPNHFVPKLVRYLRNVVPRSVARADRVLADSQATHDDLIEHLGTPGEKIDVLYSGVSERFSPASESGERDRLQERYAIGERPYALSVGTLQPRKNYPRLIEAFGQVDTEAELLIAGGKGWLVEEIDAAAARHAGDVRLLGFVDDGDLPALYRNATLFAFPSLYEGFGLPVLEAMACGTPVVCSNTSSLPEVAGEAALLVDPTRVDAIAAAIDRALSDRELRETLVERGLAQAARFTWERAGRQLHQMLEEDVPS